jgi:hypothetical protein
MKLTLTAIPLVALPTLARAADAEVARLQQMLVKHPEADASAVKNACDAVGVPARAYFSSTEPKLTGDWETALRAFLLEHLAAASAP